MPETPPVQPPNRETPPSPERPRFAEGLEGLQARMLLGSNREKQEALNPENRTLGEIAHAELGGFQTRDYGIFQNASGYERQTYWRGREGDNFDRQKQVWIEQTNATFTNGVQFFTSTEGQRWSQTFQQIAGIDTAHFSAEALYQKYFSDGKSDVKKFVADVIRAHTRPGAEGQPPMFDYELFRQNRDAIQWLSNIFGKKSSEIITQLADAEVTLATTPERLLEAVNHQEQRDTTQVRRVNNLKPKEIELLTFLWQHRQATEPTPQPPQGQGDDQPPPAPPTDEDEQGQQTPPAANDGGRPQGQGNEEPPPTPRTEPAEPLNIANRDQARQAVQQLQAPAQQYIRERQEYDDMGDAVRNDIGAVPPTMPQEVEEPLRQLLQTIPGINDQVRVKRGAMSARDNQLFVSLFDNYGLLLGLKLPTPENPTIVMNFDRAIRRDHLETALRFSDQMEFSGGQLIIRGEQRPPGRPQRGQPRERRGVISFDATGKVTQVTGMNQRYQNLQYIDLIGILRNVTDPNTGDNLNIKNLILS